MIKTRKFLKKEFLTEEEIEDIINKEYSNRSEYTKDYIREGFRREGVKFSIGSRAITRKDFELDYLKSREKNDYIVKYDFSKLPDIINNQQQKVIVICREKINGVEVGEWITSYRELIKFKREVIPNIITYINWRIVNDEEKTLSFINQATKLYENKFDYSESKFTRSDVPVKIKCNICGKYFWQTPHNHLQGQGCPRCNKISNRKSITIKEDEFISRSEEKWPGKISYLGKYNGYTNPMKLKCNICGHEFERTPKIYLICVHHCPECAKQSMISLLRSNKDEFIEKAYKVHGYKRYDYSQFIYIDNKTKGLIIDPQTGDKFWKTPNEHLSGGGNPYLENSMSLGEQRVYSWLKENNIEFSSEEIEIDVRNDGHRVRIDFEVSFNNKIYWIEYNGKQHYQFDKGYMCYINMTEEEGYSKFLEQVDRDTMVRDYCKNKSIELIEISYKYKTPEMVWNLLTDIFFNGVSIIDATKLNPEIKFKV